ncbi:MAG: hypothetical protein GY934_03785 [Gammaproteobacteria bacterium]|nr:hypothetical protein [Gammaproteobacteria bacterium]
MSGNQAQTGSSCAHRFLAAGDKNDADEVTLIKLESWLRRLRPARAEVIGVRLQSYQRLVLALNLLRRLFPETFASEQRYLSSFSVLHQPPTSKAEDMTAMGHGLLGVSWWEVLTRIIFQVQTEEWFEVNWPVLNDAFARWVADPAQNNGDHLAVYLHFLPIMLYGFTEKPEVLFEYPPAELLHALLSDCEVRQVSARTLEHAGLYHSFEDWTEADKEGVWALLDTIDSDPGLWPEAVRNLPEIARWACHKSGNIVLDRCFAPHDKGTVWLQWGDHLAAVKMATRRARPVMKAFHRLMDWYQAEPTRLSKLANFLIKGDDCNELNW